MSCNCRSHTQPAQSINASYAVHGVFTHDMEQNFARANLWGCPLPVLKASVGDGKLLAYRSTNGVYNCVRVVCDVTIIYVGKFAPEQSFLQETFSVAKTGYAIIFRAIIFAGRIFVRLRRACDHFCGRSFQREKSFRLRRPCDHFCGRSF